ncbi:MAG: dTDP-glucose 4,6-dehydratase [Chthonomonadales bacterium]
MVTANNLTDKDIVLVTGAAGFIGSNFVKLLLAERNCRVLVMDALTYAGNPANLEPFRSDPRFAFYPGKIEDPTVVNGILRWEKVTGLVNFAAESHNDRSMLDPTSLIATNTTGVANLLEASRRFGVKKIVHVSTDEVYGEKATGLFVETDPLAPRQPYSAAKAGGDLQATAHAISFSAPVSITRGSNTFGPNQYPEKILPFFITRAMQDKKLPLYGDGSQVRDWIFVEDHCRGVLAALENGLPGEAYNIGGGNERTNIEVTRKILGHLNKPESLIKPIIDPRGKGHDFRYALDSTKAVGIGFKPRADFDNAIKETVNWYVNNESWWRPIVESNEYQVFVKRYYGPALGDDL